MNVRKLITKGSSFLLALGYLCTNTIQTFAQVIVDPESPEGEAFLEREDIAAIGCKLDLDDPQIVDAICYVLYATEYLVAAAGAVCVFFIAWGSYRYFYDLRHPGEGSVQQGRATIYHAIIGLVVCVMAYVIITTLMEGITRGF